MNQQAMMSMWETVRPSTGIALRAVEALPADQLDAHPIRDMRTPRELVAHLFGMMRGIAEGALRGEILADYDALPAEVRTREQLVAWCRECWQAADRAAHGMTDAGLAGMVKTPWGVSFPGFVCFGFIHDELLHHRGQLYVYLRQLGVEPPMLWDFEHNAPEFQPKQSAPA